MSTTCGDVLRIAGSSLLAIGTLVALVVTLSIGSMAAEGTSGRVSIRGTIIDDTGRPVDDVRMAVSKTSFLSEFGGIARMLFSYKDTHTEVQRTVSGSFKLSCWRCSAFHVSFSKPGHFEETRVWKVPEGKNSRRELVIDDAVVVLERQPDPVQTVSLRGTMRFDAAGVREVALLGGEHGGTKHLSSDAALASMEAPFASLVVATGSNGTLLRRTLAVEGRPKMKRTVPVAAKVIFSEADDGVVLHQPTVPPNREDLVFRAMREAPETGYVNEIDFTHMNVAEDLHYFYCRIGGRFGKGVVITPSFASLNRFDEAVSTIHIMLNPDGSRNITTWD